VHHVVGVHVFDGGEGLAEELEGFCFSDALLPVLVAEKRSVLCEFHDHVDDVVLDEGVPEFDEVRVVHAGVEVDFPL
jgi:hypothetical protein